MLSLCGLKNIWKCLSHVFSFNHHQQNLPSSYSSARRCPLLHLPASVLDSEVREGRQRRRRRKGVGGGVCGGCPIGILQHLWCSLVFREPSVDQEDKKEAPEPRRHSTGKRRFLSLRKFTHQSKDPVLCFLSTLCLSVCSLCAPQAGRCASVGGG